MVFALLFILLLTTLAGLNTLGAEGKGPLAKLSLSSVNKAYADRDKSHADIENHDDRTYNRQDRNEDVKDKKRVHFWKDIHEFFAGVLIFLIAIHICGVIVSSYFHRENLILAMFTGEKKG